MTTYFLDTSVMIDALNGKRGRYEFLKELLLQGHLLACTSIQVSEIYVGLRPGEERETEAFLRSLEYYDVTWEIARLAGILKRDYGKKGITLALADVTIAAVAITHQLTLITDNVKRYPMKNLLRYPLP